MCITPHLEKRAAEKSEALNAVVGALLKARTMCREAERDSRDTRGAEPRVRLEAQTLQMKTEVGCSGQKKQQVQRHGEMRESRVGAGSHSWAGWLGCRGDERWAGARGQPWSDLTWPAEEPLSDVHQRSDKI